MVRLTTITLNALPAEMYSTVKLEATRDPGISLEHIQQDEENDLHQSFRKDVSYEKGPRAQKVSRVEL